MTPDEERLLHLMRALASKPGYASGAERFPERVAPEDAAAIAADLLVAVDRGVEMREAQVAAEGAEIACRPGCHACCEQLVGVWAGEAELVAAWLEEPDHGAERAHFLAAYPDWWTRSREGIADVGAQTETHGQARALAAHWQRHVLCAFNRDGLCTIYPVRPGVCRTCHALGTSDDCVPDEETISHAEVMHFVPLERLLEKARTLSRAVHLALGGERDRALVLCEAVAARLAARPPS